LSATEINIKGQSAEGSIPYKIKTVTIQNSKLQLIALNSLSDILVQQTHIHIKLKILPIK
jgi:hypothetical protein